MKNINKLLLIGIVLVSILFVVFGNDDGSAVESAKIEEIIESVPQDVEIPDPTPTPTQSPSGFAINDSMVPPPPTTTTTPISEERPVVLEIDQKDLVVNITVDPNGNEIAGIQFDVRSDVLQVNEVMFYDIDQLFSNWEIINERTVRIIGFPESSTRKFTFASISFTGNSGKAVIEINKIIVTDKEGNIISAKYG